MTTIQIHRAGQTKPFEINNGMTLGDALRQAGHDPETLRAAVDGQLADMTRVLEGDETIVLEDIPATGGVPDTGGQMQVRVAKFPNKPVQATMQSGSTVAQALEAAGITDTRGFDVRVNGELKNMDYVLRDNDAVFLTTAVEGNLVPEDEQAWMDALLVSELSE